MHIRCRWVYGTTVIPYYDHTMRDEEGTDSERLSLLSGVSGVKIYATDILIWQMEITGSTCEVDFKN